MKKWLLVIVGALVVGFVILGNSSYHLERNKHNVQPLGKLKHITDDSYMDEQGYEWILQPHIKNAFHQPDSVVHPPEKMLYA